MIIRRCVRTLAHFRFFRKVVRTVVSVGEEFRRVHLLHFRGYVAKFGAVRASVTVHDKYGSGSGRISSSSDRGRWSGYEEMRDARATEPRNETQVE
jgi:hypothetical protein